MTLLLISIYIVMIVSLLIAVGVRPYRTTMSRFELRRRTEDGDEYAASLLRRESLLHDIFSLQRVVVAVLLVVISTLGGALFGWLFGLMASLLVALEAGAVARIPFFQSRSQKLYEKYEPKLLDLVEKVPGLFTLLRNVNPETNEARHLQSREELLHLVSQAGELLSSDEKQLINHALAFKSRLVSEIMTPRSMIDSVKKDELLGPLVLHDLHRTGHSRFPVIDGDIDHVVGILHVHSLLTLSKKRSVKAKTAMDSKVHYIREDQSLHHALAAFMRTHRHLFIVVNQYRETVGLLSLEDIIEALLGREIIDEFDSHDDLREVARRNPHGNNKPEKSEDV